MGGGAVGEAAGYRTHAAPELYAGNPNTELSDIFAVGITLFRLVNQYSDWSMEVDNVADSYAALLRGKLIQKIGFQNFVPRKFKTIINKACNPNPARRYTSCEEFRQALERLRVDCNWQYGNGIWSCQKGPDLVELSLRAGRYHHVEYKKKRKAH